MKMIHKKLRKNNCGLTLVELMITVFILAIGILGTLMYFSTAIASSEIARDTTVATTHAEFLLEEMRTRTTLASITGEGWEDWAGANGLNTLPGEVIAVAYADAGADPLNVQATVSWIRKSRAGSVTLTTELTK